MTDKRTMIEMKDLLGQRAKEGKPLVVIEPSSISDNAVEAWKKLLPEDTQNAVILVDLGEKIHKRKKMNKLVK